VAFRERFQVRTDVVYTCTRTTVNDDHSILAGAGHLIEDLSTGRAGQKALGRCTLCSCSGPACWNRGKQSERGNSMAEHAIEVHPQTSRIGRSPESPARR
jgi:hypothetical protein